MFLLSYIYVYNLAGVFQTYAESGFTSTDLSVICQQTFADLFIQILYCFHCFLRDVILCWVSVTLLIIPMLTGIPRLLAV